MQEDDDTVSSLDELSELAATAGAVTVGRLIQNREAPHPGTYLGKGKIEELKQLIWEEDATGIICDDELSPAQLANLQDMLDTKVMDRTLIILDIFAQRASTREGKIQVELAQLRYRATPVSYTHLDIGTRGISAFIVEKGWEGFEFGDHYDKMGIRSSSTAELIFNDVKVPKENLLGKEGDGFKIAMSTLDGCLLYTSRCV